MRIFYNELFVHDKNLFQPAQRKEKIVYVLWTLDDEVDETKFEKKLITHSHTGLRDKIKEVLKIHNENIEFSKQENALFELLCGFYNTARYMRFNIDGDWDKELELIRTFLKSDSNYVKNNTEFFYGSRIEANENVKKLFGRTLKSIAVKYYELVEPTSRRSSTE